jgi:hypothetical protein
MTGVFMNLKYETPAAGRLTGADNVEPDVKSHETGQKSSIKLWQDLSKRFSLIPLNGKDPSINGQKWEKYCLEKKSFHPREYKNRNAGVCCGPASGVLVIDIDDPSCFKALRIENHLEIPDSFTVKTGSGYHLYYEYPQDGKAYGCKSFKHPIFTKATVFDVKGLGGQVVAPGSIHPDTGKPYIIEKDLPIAPAPEWLKAYVLGVLL